ncbi:MAG: hypothetical protein M3336_10915, partial [Chloroflexota bacterium]|nr:hypothetical protein [Chloroflexota bacterium]
ILYGGAEVTPRQVGAVLPLDRDAPAVPPARPDTAAPEQALSDALDAYEKTLITRALSVAGGNIAEAARRLRTDRPNLYRRMRRLGIGWGGAEVQPQMDRRER